MTERRPSFPDKKSARSDYDRVTAHIQEARNIQKEADIGQESATWIAYGEYPNLPITFTWMSDIHYGHVGVDYDRLNLHLDIVEETPNMFVIFGGDDTDNFGSVKHSHAGIMGDAVNPQTQIEAWMGRIGELDAKSKIGAMTHGNHNDWVNYVGLDFYRTFWGEIQAPVFTKGGILNIHANGGQLYRAAISHQFWGRCLAPSTRLLTYLDGKPSYLMLKDLLKLRGNDDGTVKNGTQLVGEDGLVDVLRFEETTQKAIRIYFRDGTTVVASDNHKWPLTDGSFKTTSELGKGDEIKTVQHHIEPQSKQMWNKDWGWFIGLFLAEGSYLNNGVQLSIHEDEVEEVKEKLDKLFSSFGIEWGTHFDKGSKGADLLSADPVVMGIIKKFVKGKTSYTKRLHRRAYYAGHEFLSGILDGWLYGDGHYEKSTGRWGAKFCRNQKLLRNIKAICTMNGYQFWQGKGSRPDGTKFYKVKIRKEVSVRPLKSSGVVVKTKRVNPGAIKLYDIEVSGNSLFMLENGVLTHNSKLNPENSPRRLMEYGAEGGEYIDIAMVGHDHQAAGSMYDRAGKDKIVVDGGTYKLKDTWGQQRWGPAGKGGYTIMLWPNEKRMELFRDPVVAQQMLLGMIYMEETKDE